MVTWKTSFADVSSFLRMIVWDVLSTVCSFFASPCFETVVSPFASAVEESCWPFVSSWLFELGISWLYSVSARAETSWEEPKSRKPELHVPDFAFGSVLSLDILKSSKEVRYMYRGSMKGKLGSCRCKGMFNGYD